MENFNVLLLAKTAVFRQLPVDVIELLLKSETVLRTMNEYTEKRYNDSFWYGGKEFNNNYRLVCPPTSVDFIPQLGWPLFVKTCFLERTPFTEGEDFAKFGLHWKLDKPLLCDDLRYF